MQYPSYLMKERALSHVQKYIQYYGNKSVNDCSWIFGADGLHIYTYLLHPIKNRQQICKQKVGWFHRTLYWFALTLSMDVHGKKSVQVSFILYIQFNSNRAQSLSKCECALSRKGITRWPPDVMEVLHWFCCWTLIRLSCHWTWLHWRYGRHRNLIDNRSDITSCVHWVASNAEFMRPFTWEITSLYLMLYSLKSSPLETTIFWSIQHEQLLSQGCCSWILR